MTDLEEKVMQLTQDLYVLKHTVIAGKTVEERIKESNTVPEDAMLGENEELKSELDYVRTIKDSAEKEIERLEEENKKLNIKVASLEGEIKGLNSVIEKLHKEIEEQEAEGGGLFDEIDYRKREAKRLGWKPNK